jgi:biotin-(acetyl-CoA carboxylase) ligase
MTQYRARFMLDGKRVVLSMADGSEKCGKVVGVDDEGGLIIEVEGGREVVKSGSVSVRIAEGEK